MKRGRSYFECGWRVNRYSSQTKVNRIFCFIYINCKVYCLFWCIVCQIWSIIILSVKSFMKSNETFLFFLICCYYLGTVFATDTCLIHDGMHWNKKQYVAKTCSFHMVCIQICVSQSNPFKNWKTNNKTADLLLSDLLLSGQHKWYQHVLNNVFNWSLTTN